MIPAELVREIVGSWVDLHGVEALAARSGVSDKTLREIFGGRRKTVRATTVDALLVAIDRHDLWFCEPLSRYRRGSTAEEIAEGIEVSRRLVAEILEEEERRGHVERVVGGWRWTEEFEREFGWAFRRLDLPRPGRAYDGRQTASAPAARERSGADTGNGGSDARTA